MTVSVLMAAYNSEKYIGEAIESVLASSFTDFELIVCDDRSADRTADIARSYELKDARVNVFVNETNLGDYPNRNRAATYATGKYIKYLDHDDVIYPWGLEVMVKCMDAYPEAGFGIMSYNLPQEKPYPILVSPADGYRAYFFKSALFAMGPTGAIFRRDAFETVNGFSGKPFVGDMEMWMTMGRKFSLVRMPQDLIWYRQHEVQESKRELLDTNAALRRFNVSADALKHIECPLPSREKAMALTNHNSVKVRLIMKENLQRFKFINIIREYKKFGITFLDFLKAFKKNQRPR